MYPAYNEGPPALQRPPITSSVGGEIINAFRIPADTVYQTPIMFLPTIVNGREVTNSLTGEGKTGMTPGSSKYEDLCRRIPKCMGVYTLIIELFRDTTIIVGSLGPRHFPSGVYVYIGSAKGRGGIRARVCRHVLREKKLRWHIDYLTTESPPSRIYYSCDKDCSESFLANSCHDKLIPWIKGFGSSDDRNSPTHLFKCPKHNNCHTIIAECFKQTGCGRAELFDLVDPPFYTPG